LVFWDQSQTIVRAWRLIRGLGKCVGSSSSGSEMVRRPPARSAASAPASVPVAGSVYINALINGLREFYSTDINDCKDTINSYAINARVNDIRHFSLAAVTVTSNNMLPSTVMYDYRSFFFARTFRCSQTQVLAMIRNNRMLLTIFFMHLDRIFLV
jgi:hypothetical protein